MKTFCTKDRVKITSSGQTGEVVYQRMKPPLYNEADAVSVLLDAKKDVWNYAGTIFPAEDVELENPDDKT